MAIFNQNIPAVSTGIITRPTITSTSTRILAANPLRAYAYIYNSSGANIYLQFGQAAVVNQGIQLGTGANGLYEITSNKLWVGDVFVIKSGSPIQIEVFEGIINPHEFLI